MTSSASSTSADGKRITAETEIPSVWDKNPKRMKHESQAYETKIPNAWDFGFRVWGNKP